MISMSPAGGRLTFRYRTKKGEMDVMANLNERNEGKVFELKNLNIFADEDDRNIVKNLSLYLNAGESLGIVGESGSGKTLTLKSIMGMLPDGVYGKYDEMTENDHIGMIFQNPVRALDPIMSVREQMREAYARHHGDRMYDDEDKHTKYVSIGKRLSRILIGDAMTRNLSSKKEDAADKWIKKICERLSLPEDILEEDRIPSTLSGGQCQRVGIAIALACDPEILLCDEPTTALDVNVQKNTINLIKELQKEYGFAMIFVTHNLAVASQICDRIMVMREGTIVEEGETDKILKSPENDYTKMLIASVLKVPELKTEIKNDDLKD